MKIITNEQIQAIIQAFYDVNAPIKLYAGVKEMLEKLPISGDNPSKVEPVEVLDKVE